MMHDLDGRIGGTVPLDNGATIYRVTLAFSDGCQPRDDESPTDNPWHWHWASLIDQSDARVIAVTENPNPFYETDPVPDTVCTVLAELIADGLIEHTGEYRNGRPVFVATTAGLATAQEAGDE